MRCYEEDSIIIDSWVLILILMEDTLWASIEAQRDAIKES